MLAECDVVSMHAMVTPETERLIGAAQFAAMKDGRDLRQLRPRAAARHRRARRARCSRATSAAPASTTSRASTSPPTIRCARCTNVVLTPHIGGATYDTEANHSKLIADDVARILRGEKPVNCVNPEVLDVMAELKGTADEIKAELLWVAQESLRTNLVHGTAGNFSARLPDGNVVLTPSSLDVRDDDARRPRRLRPRRQRASRASAARRPRRCCTSRA